MIKSISIRRFRGFEALDVDLTPHAFLVGPNSAGKSTIIEAVGLAERCIRTTNGAAKFTQKLSDGRIVMCYPLPKNVGAEDDPIRFEFGEDEATLTVEWQDAGTVSIVWPEEGIDDATPFFFVVDSNGFQPKTHVEAKAQFHRVFVVPVITPLDRSEELKNPAYIDLHINGRLASRHFRNHALKMDRSGEWESFKSFACSWLPEVELLDVQLHTGSNQLAVFFREPGSRVPKELAWAGDGIQIWVQLLWHIYRGREAKTIVLDEPEVYLHPNLQRRLVRLLDSTGAQIMLASHSAEVIAEAPAAGVVWVDRRLSMAKRARSQQTLSDLSEGLGSSYNLTLVRSSRSKMLIAADYPDAKVLRVLAKHVGAERIANDSAVSIITLNDTTSWAASSQLGKSLREVLPNGVQAHVLLQSRFRSRAQNTRIREQLTAPGIGVSFLGLPEIENYLLDPTAIARASGAAPEIIALRIDEACSELLDETRSLHVAGAIGAAPRGTSVELVLEAEKGFDGAWAIRHQRPQMVQGTRVLRALNSWLDIEGYRTVNSYSLAKAMRPQSLAAEIFKTLLQIDEAIK